MNDKKRLARLAYDEGIEQAVLREFTETEDRVRNLEGLSEKEIDKIVADVHIRHEKSSAVSTGTLLKNQTDSNVEKMSGCTVVGCAEYAAAIDEGKVYCPKQACMTQNVLFLRTGNSACSILAEAILNRGGAGRFRAYSAGSNPKGVVHPGTLTLLGELGYPTARYRPKSWDEFASADAPPLDLVVTVCDNAAGQVCPSWPEKRARARWGIADPAAVEGAAQHAAFLAAYRSLEERIGQLLASEVAHR